jgi:hypothetical protein
MKLMGVIGESCHVTDQLMIFFLAFVRYLRKNISYSLASRKPMIQWAGKPSGLQPNALTTTLPRACNFPEYFLFFESWKRNSSRCVLTVPSHFMQMTDCVVSHRELVIPSTSKEIIFVSVNDCMKTYSSSWRIPADEQSEVMWLLLSRTRDKLIQHVSALTPHPHYNGCYRESPTPSDPSAGHCC